MTGDSTGYRYRLEVEAEFDARVRLALELPEVEQPFYLIPPAAVMDAWLHVNWGPVSTLGGQEYYRNGGLSFDQEGLADGRPLCEIGWTASEPMLYPFAVAEQILGLIRDDFGHRKNRVELIDMIFAAYATESGVFNDLTIDWRLSKPFWDKVPLNKISRNNGWWTGYIIGNQHSAYNNGSACHYILKTIDFLRG